MSVARNRIDHYLAVAAANGGNVEAWAWDRGLGAGARWRYASEPARVFEVLVNEAGGVEREQELSGKGFHRGYVSLIPPATPVRIKRGGGLGRIALGYLQPGDTRVIFEPAQAPGSSVLMAVTELEPVEVQA